MRSGTEAAGWNALAPITGAVAGLVALVLLGTVVGLIRYRYPLSPAAADWALFAVRCIGYVVAGLWAGRRAGDSGLFHGATAGLLQLAAVIILALVAREGWPAGAALLRQLGLALTAGALGGILGVNLAD